MGLSSVMESIKRFLFNLFLAIDGFGHRVRIPIKSDSLKGLNEMVHQLVPFSAKVTTRFDKMCNVLFRVVLSLKI